MRLSLTEVVRRLVEITWLLKLDLSVAECSSATIESLKEGVAEEGSRVLSKVHLGLLSLI